MHETIHNKLVRDKIPEIIKSHDEMPVVRVLNGNEYREALLEKLIEEAKELLVSDGSIDERADVAEVLCALDAVCGWSEADIEEARDDKNDKRGSFTKRLYLEKTVIQ